MAKYFQDNNNIYVAPDNASVILDHLPAAVYSLEFAMLKGFFLQQKTDFTTPTKVYGNIAERANRIIKTYMSRDTMNTGVLLSGEKGSGKTMMSKLISQLLVQQGIPTILINNNFDAGFNNFLSDINQRVCIIFDEFEKIFDEEHQNKLLSLFDGVHESNKLNIVTINNLFKLNDFFINRPGRMYYHLEFNTLEESFVKEYCEDNLNNKEHIQSVLSLSKVVTRFNFDMLKHLVYECNLHEVSPKECIGLLNINMTPEGAEYDYKIRNNKTGKEYTGNQYIRPSEVTYIDFYNNDTSNDNISEDDEEGDDEPIFFIVQPKSLQTAKNGVLVYTDGDLVCELRKRKITQFRMDF